MSTYKELDPEMAWKAIEGHENILSPAAKAQEAFYRQFRCPRCRQGLEKEFDPRHTYADPDSIVARALLRCGNCSYLIDPHSDIVLEYGDASKIPIEAIPIIGQSNSD